MSKLCHYDFAFLLGVDHHDLDLASLLLYELGRRISRPRPWLFRFALRLTHFLVVLGPMEIS